MFFFFFIVSWSDSNLNIGLQRCPRKSWCGGSREVFGGREPVRSRARQEVYRTVDEKKNFGISIQAEIPLLFDDFHGLKMCFPNKFWSQGWPKRRVRLRSSVWLLLQNYQGGGQGWRKVRPFAKKRRKAAGRRMPRRYIFLHFLS